MSETLRRALPGVAQVLVLLLGMVLAGCRAFAAPFTPPEAGGPSWVEVTSPHFVVYSDLDPADARAAAVELERVYTTLHDIGFPYKTQPSDRVRVLLFRSRDEYARVGPYGSAGLFASDVWLGGEGPEPVAVFYGEFTEQMRATLRHELTHRFVHFYYPKAPAWLNEGLAHYYETLSLEDGEAVVGKQPAISKHRRPGDPVPSLDALLAMRSADLLPDARRPGSRETARANRASAWAFVHFLKSGPERYRTAFDAFLARLGKGADFALAWDEAKGFLDPEKLDADLASALHGGRQYFLLRTKYTPPPAEVEGARPMSPAEVHLLWAAILKDPAAQIEAALRLSPESPAALRTRAHLFSKAGSLDAAEQDLEKALSLSPDDPRVLFDLFLIEARRAKAKGAPPRFRERAEALVPRLVPVASTAYTQRMLASTLAAWGRTPQAMQLALRSIQTDPSCWRCYETVAALLFEGGDLTDAVKAQELALGLMPESTADSVVSTGYGDLRQYQAAAKTRFSNSVLRTIVRRRVDGYQRCYTEGLARDRSLEGRVIARLVIEPDGTVSNATDEGSTLPDKQVVQCVLAELRQLHFPARKTDAAQVVTHPLTFSPSDGQAPAAPAPGP